LIHCLFGRLIQAQFIATICGDKQVMKQLADA
jgi:hypothetical protein